MQRLATRLAAVATQFLLLCRECAQLRITTRTAVAGVKSMSSRDAFDRNPNHLIRIRQASFAGRTPYLIATCVSTVHVALLVIEQPFLAPQAAAIAAESSIGTNDTMARDDDANHVGAIRAANRATRIFITQALCHP